MNLSLESAFGIHSTALKLRAQRAGIIAANMANADTPGYKAVDIDLRAALSRTAAASAALSATRTHRRHISHNSAAVGGVRTGYRVPNHPSLDGNTVDADLERAAYIDNAMRYQASLNILDGRIKGLMLAVKGQ